MKPFRLFHFDIKTLGNYGDTLLFEAVRQLFHGYNDRGSFRFHGSTNLRDVVGPKLVSALNENYDAIVIGGGGLFLSDTNPNERSGWQWNCSLDLLEKIDIPIIVFAVGNNRFPGQKDFSPKFVEHVNLLAEKSIFFGLRNRGSVETIKEYLRPELRDKVVYQPCPTTLSSYLFPDIHAASREPKRELSIQALVGKRQTAAGFDKEAIYDQCFEALNGLRSKGWNISSFSNARGDNAFAVEMRETLASDEHHKLFGSKNIFQALDFFARTPLVVGMRGHAQMIPFGLGTPILSLLVHNKLKYFLDDIGFPEFCVDVRRANFAGELIDKAEHIYENYDAVTSGFERARAGLMDLSISNLGDIYKALGGRGQKKKFVPMSPFERYLAQQGYNSQLRLEELKRAEEVLVREPA